MLIMLFYHNVLLFSKHLFVFLIFIFVAVSDLTGLSLHQSGEISYHFTADLNDLRVLDHVLRGLCKVHNTFH